MFRLIVELLIALLLVVFAGDILYLYYSGAWCEPIKIIEVSELVFFYASIVLGLSYFSWRFRRAIKGD